MAFLIYSIPKNQLNSPVAVTQHEQVETEEEAKRRFEELRVEFPNLIVNYREV
jgi:hypothetical protein